MSVSARIEFSDVSVRFGPLLALKNVSFEARAGEIIGVLGHNGAGKSTLVNVACGVVTIDSGSINLDGRELEARTSPRDMQRLGVNVVHQEPAVCSNLSVLDNLLLSNSRIVGRKRGFDRATAALSKVGLEVEPKVPAGVLGLGGRQLLSIARGLMERQPRVIFLDEPAASLGQKEADRLHGLILGLAQEGATVFYVSHRLKDIVAVCERYIILRDGVLVEDRSMHGLTSRGLAQSLTGGILPAKSDAQIVPKSDPVILSSPQGLEVRKGEIIGLFGMAGGEQFDILGQLFGVVPGNEFDWLGLPYKPRSPMDAIASGVHMVQADREVDSLLGNMNALDNVIVPWVGKISGTRFPSPNNKAIRAAYADSRQLFNISGPTAAAPIGSFSGGNRQKHVLARWIVPRGPRLLLLAQPTQGIDENSKNEIADALRSLASSGVPIIVASAESDEISRLCDRAYVFSNGECHEEKSGKDFDERLISRLLAKPNQSGGVNRRLVDD